jgi:abequosyltransferase
VCIPTHNYGRFIGETLESIVCQASEEVEIVVLDGASTDNTNDVVEGFQCVFRRLRYYRQDFKGGIDRDIEKVVSLAHGKYCWLFSADDIMVPGAIEKVLEAMKSNHDVYLCEHDLSDLTMNFIMEYPIFKNLRIPKLFNLGDASQRKTYFQSAKTSEAFFSFLSGPIFKKEIWDCADIPESFRGTCWIVAGHLLTMIPKGFTVNYLAETLLHKREGNDSFSMGSFVNRQRITIENFQHVSNFVFGERSEEAFHIRRVLHLDSPFLSLIYAKLKVGLNPEAEDINVLNRIVKMHYADPNFGNWMKLALYKTTHPVALKAAYRLKKLWEKIQERDKRF